METGKDAEAKGTLAERAAALADDQKAVALTAAAVERDALDEVLAVIEAHDVAGLFEELRPLVAALPDGRAKAQGLNFLTLLANAPNAFKRERQKREEEINPSVEAAVDRMLAGPSTPATAPASPTKGG